MRKPRSAATSRKRARRTGSRLHLHGQQPRLGERDGEPCWGASVIHDVPGHISVGATTLGDERVTDFSSGGQVEIAAPGVQSPVGPPGRDGRPERIDGTSFSTPYAAGVAALMLQTNPRLSTAQIQEILQSTARNLPGERDGAGVIDPVAAVRRARELAAAR